MGDPARVAWIDDRLGDPAEAAALACGPGCYTTARADCGRVWHLERHVQRLARDARALGLGDLDAERVRRALLALARAAFPDGAGAVRLEARPVVGCAEPAPVHLLGSARSLGPDPPTWRAVIVGGLHPGPGPGSAAKTTERAPFAAALARARAAAADEALLLDAAGRLVEGARSSVVVVRADGALVTPPLARGAQAGIGRALLLERVPALEEADVAGEELAAAREIAVVNAVRGVRPIVALDEHPVGAGARRWTEPVSRRTGQLAHAFSQP